MTVLDAVYYTDQRYKFALVHDSFDPAGELRVIVDFLT